MKVLVLDDNPDDLHQVRRALTGVESIEVSYLQDPEQASQAVLAAKQASGDRIALFRPSAPPVVYDNRPGGG